MVPLPWVALRPVGGTCRVGRPGDGTSRALPLVPAPAVVSTTVVVGVVMAAVRRGG